ncbi:MAG: hypothetical protein U0361_13915 [Nitrospiraceae bacterium]
MVRLAIPRRVYTSMQIAYVAESIAELYRQRDRVQGLTTTYEAPVLRHFTARFEAVQQPAHWVPRHPRGIRWDICSKAWNGSKKRASG